MTRISWLFLWIRVIFSVHSYSLSVETVITLLCKPNQRERKKDPCDPVLVTLKTLEPLPWDWDVLVLQIRSKILKEERKRILLLISSIGLSLQVQYSRVSECIEGNSTVLTREHYLFVLGIFLLFIFASFPWKRISWSKSWLCKLRHVF